MFLGFLDDTVQFRGIATAFIQIDLKLTLDGMTDIGKNADGSHPRTALEGVQGSFNFVDMRLVIAVGIPLRERCVYPAEDFFRLFEKDFRQLIGPVKVEKYIFDYLALRLGLRHKFFGTGHQGLLVMQSSTVM